MSFSRLSNPRFAPTGRALTRDQERGVFGQVMGLVALTLGTTALGAYVGRNLSGGTGILFLLIMLGCVIGLQAAAARGHEQLAIGLLLGLGLTLGIFLGPVRTGMRRAGTCRPGQGRCSSRCSRCGCSCSSASSSRSPART
jgi:FtsH-binding integral membrane protein